jgi:hypothetical protein
MLLHRDSGLIAIVCDDMVVRVLDIETRKIVREMSGFRGRILDIVSLGILLIVIFLLIIPLRSSRPTQDGL